MSHQVLAPKRVLLSFTHRNLSGNGDSIDADLRKTEGLNAWHVNYSFPINRQDATVYFDAQTADSEVLDDAFSSLDIESESSTYSLGVDYPVQRSSHSQFSVFASLEKRNSKSFLLGFPFSFSEGVENGEANITALRLGLNWTRRNRQQAIALRSTLSAGIDCTRCHE